MIKSVSWKPTFISLNCIKNKTQSAHSSSKAQKREIIPFKEPERLSEEGEKRNAKCKTLYSTKSLKHLKGGRAKNITR